MELMATSNIDKKKYFVKFMTIGTKILLQNIDDYKTAIAALKSQNMQFFTHDIQADKAVKFVLSGVHETPIDEIKFALEENNIKCLDVKKNEDQKR